MTLRRQLGPRGAITALALGLFACGGASSPVADAVPPTVGAPPRLVLPQRPHAVEDVAVDYASLPRMTPLAIGPGAKGPWFKLRTDGLYELHMPDDLYAEIQVGSTIFFSVPGDERAAELIGPAGGQARPGANGDLYTPSTAGQALCHKSNQVVRAVWIGFSPKSKTPSSMEFVRYEGTFDPTTCTTRPIAAWHVAAPAILEGALYAFRGGIAPPDPASPEGAALKLVPGHPGNASKSPALALAAAAAAPPPGSQPGVEKLEIIGPRSMWVGSTAPTAEQRVPLSQPFARLVVPISRGSTATAVLDVGGEDLKRFRGADTAALADAKVVSFSFDVVWGSSESLPTAVATMSALPGLPEQLVPPPEARYDFEVNLEE